MSMINLLPDSLIEKLLTDETITTVGDELLPKVGEWGHRVAVIKKEKDNKYYIHKCIIRYSNRKWVVEEIEDTMKFTDAIKNVLKWKKQAQKK